MYLYVIFVLFNHRLSHVQAFSKNVQTFYKNVWALFPTRVGVLLDGEARIARRRNRYDKLAAAVWQNTRSRQYEGHCIAVTS